MLILSISCTRFKTNYSNVHLGAVKLYVEAVEALRKKERRDETEFTTKIELNANVLFL